MEVETFDSDLILSDEVLERLKRDALESCVLCTLDDLGDED